MIDAVLTLGVVCVVTILLAREYLGPDLVMFGGLSALVVCGVLDPTRALAGFGNPALATIAVLFPIAAAVQETGALQVIARTVLGAPKPSRWSVARLMGSTALLSAFLNNIPIVALLIPAVLDFAKRVGTSPSRFLMPLSFAAMLGGTSTLIGTSSNLVISGLLESVGQEPLAMLEMAWVGVPTALVGVLYMTTVGQWLLPDRVDPQQVLHDEARQYLAEVEVADDSPLRGQTIEEAGLRGLPGLFLVEIRRADGSVLRPAKPSQRLQAADHLVFSGLASTVQDLRKFPGLRPTGVEASVAELEEKLFEVVVSYRSTLIGKTVKEAEFRRRFNAAILAVHRAGGRIETRIGDIVLKAGDTLMLSAEPGFGRTYRDSIQFLVVSDIPGGSPPRYRKAKLALGVVGALVLVPTLTGTPILVPAMAALVVLLVTGCVTPGHARKSVGWQVLVLVGSAIGISEAMVVSGAAHWVADALVQTTMVLGPRGTLAGIYVMTLVFALFVGNAASAALMFPIAASTAMTLGVEIRPFAIGTAMAASAAFSTPVGYAANLLVYGPGGYRYLDFTRVGVPLNVLCLVVVLVVVPWVWPF
jgi:di/tricarboxylate transporter